MKINNGEVYSIILFIAALLTNNLAFYHIFGCLTSKPERKNFFINKRRKPAATTAPVSF
jgi:hypothetical protein